MHRRLIKVTHIQQFRIFSLPNHDKGGWDGGLKFQLTPMEVSK